MRSPGDPHFERKSGVFSLAPSCTRQIFCFAIAFSPPRKNCQAQVDAIYSSNSKSYPWALQSSQCLSQTNWPQSKAPVVPRCRRVPSVAPPRFWTLIFREWIGTCFLTSSKQDSWPPPDEVSINDYIQGSIFICVINSQYLDMNGVVLSFLSQIK